MKIAYCGYDFFYGCLNALLSKSDVEVLKIFTFKTDNKYNFNTKIIDLANRNNIPYTLEKISNNDIEILFEENGCDCIITAAYPYKVPIGNYCGINIHPTLLPVGKGPWPLPKIILSNQKESGVTIHKLSNEFDSGDIILQKSFTINSREDLETLSCRSQILANSMILELFSNFYKFWNNAIPQTEGEYWNYPTDEEMSFNGNMTVEEIDRIVRAYGKFDSCVTFNNKNWLVWDVNCWTEKHSYEPGTIVHETNKEYLMAVRDGFVCFRFYKEDKYENSNI